MHINHTGFDLTERKIFHTGNDSKSVILTLGKGSYIVSADYEIPSFRSHILIGNYCSLAQRIKFVIGINHAYKRGTTYPFEEVPPARRRLEQIYSGEFTEFEKSLPTDLMHRSGSRQIIIGNDVWIGMDVTITGGVKIGSGAVIGANSTVTKNVPPYAIVVCNPARVIKYRFDQATIKNLWLLNGGIGMLIKFWKMLSSCTMPTNFWTSIIRLNLNCKTMWAGWELTLQNIVRKAERFIVLLLIFRLTILCGKGLSADFISRVYKVRF